MKLYVRGRFKLTLEKLVPMFSAVDITQDDPPYDTILRWYSVEWLGWSINLDVPVTDKKKRKFMHLSPAELLRRMFGMK